jgi:hypothetical protein
MEERNDQVDKGPAGDRKREGYAELDRLLKQAIRCLEGTDLRGANEALKRAGAEAASLRDDAGSPELAGSSTPEAQNTFADAGPVLGGRGGAASGSTGTSAGSGVPMRLPGDSRSLTKLDDRG